MSRYSAVSLARKLVRRFKTRDPFEVAEELGITILYLDCKKQKGAFKVIVNQMFIYINDNLSDQMKRVICAHELGHALMHKALGATQLGLLEFELFDMTSSCEYEANVFAAALLLDNEETIDTIFNYNDYVKAACELGVNVNLLLVKVPELIDEGYSLRLPRDAESCFLGNCVDGVGEL